jgi:PAS domain-containing protein
MQLQRYLLALIEDLTPERTQMRLNHKKELQLLRANKELEERLRRVDALVFDASEKLQQKMTGHSLSEDRLANERRQFQVLVELTRSGLAIVRDDGAFKYTNSRFKELFGYDLADLPNCRESFAEASADSGHASEEEVCWFDVLSAADEGQSGPLTLTVTCKSGQKKMVDFKTVKLDNGDYLLLCEETAT